METLLSKKINAMKDKILIFILISVFAMFILVIFHNRITVEDKTLKKSSEIDLFVDEIIDYKGVLTLNDSIVISKNCPSLNNPALTTGNLTKPFQIIKKADNDTIKVIKNGNTLYFLLIEF